MYGNDGILCHFESLNRIIQKKKKNSKVGKACLYYNSRISLITFSLCSGALPYILHAQRRKNDHQW